MFNALVAGAIGDIVGGEAVKAESGRALGTTRATFYKGARRE